VPFRRAAEPTGRGGAQTQIKECDAMNRRNFSAAGATLLGASALGLPGLALAQRKPEDGKDYKELDKRAAVEAPAGKIEVVEFFWYSCPHCNAFEPKLVSWIKSAPADVVVRRVPVAFRDDFVPQQRLFYTLEAMGKLDELHHKVFDAIHGQKQPTNREEGIVAFAEKNGIERAKFLEVYNSFSVQTKARRATQLQDAYKVEGVPALGIAGRYYTDGSMAGNMDRALQVTQYLIAEARKAR
jgi:thiol:disulfide interchange protein DsbA